MCDMSRGEAPACRSKMNFEGLFFAAALLWHRRDKPLFVVCFFSLCVHLQRRGGACVLFLRRCRLQSATIPVHKQGVVGGIGGGGTGHYHKVIPPCIALIIGKTGSCRDNT